MLVLLLERSSEEETFRTEVDTKGETGGEFESVDEMGVLLEEIIEAGVVEATDILSVIASICLLFKSGLSDEVTNDGSVLRGLAASVEDLALDVVTSSILTILIGSGDEFVYKLYGSPAGEKALLGTGVVEVEDRLGVNA